MMGRFNEGWNAWIIAMMLLWPVAIGVAVWAVASLTRGGSEPSGVHETPRQLLDQRLALGEITAAEYHQTRAVLDNGAMTGPTITGSR